jgi:predicted permease
MNLISQLLRRRQMRDDLREEIQEHLEEQTQHLMRDGLSRREAARQARIAFGNPSLVKEHSDEVWMWPFLATVIADIRYALRQLRKSLGFTIGATLTLMLGIGANLAIFNLLDALLLESLPVHNPDSLVHLAAHNGMASFGEANAPINLNLPIIEAIQQRAQSFDGVIGWTGSDFTLDEDGNVRTFPGALVSGNAFGVLGLKPAAGRLLEARDDRPGGGPGGWVAVVSYGFWREHYGGSPAIIGERATLSDQSVTIVGVAPRGFGSIVLDNHPAFYLPLEFDVASRGERSVLHSAGAMWLTTLARLKPGVSRAQAAAEMNSLWPGILDAVVPPKMRHARFIESMGFNVLPGRTGWSYLRVTYARPVKILQGMVGLLFVLCCANLAGLCLARAAARQQEFAIRGALGAVRARLLRQVLIESLVLALPGAAIAVLFAWQADRLLTPMLGLGGMRLTVHFDPWLFVIAPCAATVAAALFGILPAWFASRFAPVPLKTQVGNSVRTTGAGWVASWLFLPLQIAVSLVLVVAAGLLMATLSHLRADNLGFETNDVYLAGIDFTKLRLARERTLHLERNIADRLRQMPGVAAASTAMATPLNGSLATSGFLAIEGIHPTDKPVELDTNEVGAGYFTVFGTPLLAGNEFSGTPADTSACILNQSAARRLLGSVNPVGHTVRVFQPQMDGEVHTRDCQVIGEVADAKYDTLREDPPATVYQAFGAGGHEPAVVTFAFRARSTSEAKSAFARTMDELGKGTSRGDLIAFAEQVDASVQRERMLALLSNFFSFVALLLSAIGVFGVMGWTVTQRVPEIGVRMALGATRSSILCRFLAKACRVAFVGLAVGVAGAWLATRSLRSLLYGVGPADLSILLLSAVVLLGTVALAAYFPARRAASTDPMEALRHE